VTTFSAYPSPCDNAKGATMQEITDILNAILIALKIIEVLLALYRHKRRR